jgi:hypothetical protein
MGNQAPATASTNIDPALPAPVRPPPVAITAPSTAAARGQVPKPDLETYFGDICLGNQLLLAAGYNNKGDLLAVERLLAKGAPVDWICGEWTPEELVGHTHAQFIVISTAFQVQ